MVIAFSARATYTDRRLQNNEWNDYKCLAIDKGRSLITNVLQLTRAARSWSELRAVRVLAHFCCACPCALLLFVWNRRSARKRTHTPCSRSAQVWHANPIFVYSAPHAPRPFASVYTGHLVHPKKCSLGRKRPAEQQLSGQLRVDKTTQTNATDTTAAGGAPEQTYHRHLRPLIRRTPLP
jgi:hypothetical protein